MIPQKTYDDRVQNNDNEVKCPRCRSTSLSVNKKGFIFKKAEVSVVLTVGVGIFAGEFETWKIMVTCLHCGKQFKASK